MKRYFSIKYKLIIAFGILSIISTAVMSIFAIRIARDAVYEKVKIQLTEKATDAAMLVDTALQSNILYLKTIARKQILTNPNISYHQKASILEKEAKKAGFVGLYICDKNGLFYLSDGTTIDVSDRYYYKKSIKGAIFVTEPYEDRLGNFRISISVPVLNNRGVATSIIVADFDGRMLCSYTRNIVVGKTGGAHIIGRSGTTIASSNIQKVKSQWNTSEEVKKNPELQALAEIETKALQSNEQAIFSTYTLHGEKKLAAGKKMKTGWAIIVSAPIGDFFDSITTLKKWMSILGLQIFAVTLIFVFILSRRIVNPIKKTVSTLKDIAEGNGDLTVRMPIKGHDEMTQLSEYFNKTMKKIHHSMQTVLTTSNDMNHVGQTLASNMSETASAINQIGANIKNVKQKVLHQSSSLTETSATMEEIIQTIQHLNRSIEIQAASVAQSSGSIEQMIANISSIANLLGNSNSSYKT